MIITSFKAVKNGKYGYEVETSYTVNTKNYNGGTGLHITEGKEGISKILLGYFADVNPVTEYKIEKIINNKPDGLWDD